MTKALKKSQAVKATPAKAPKAKIQKIASTVAEKAEAVILKTRLTCRPSFQGRSQQGNRMRNFNSLHIGNTYTAESIATMPAGNFYNPRDLGGKKHNPKNVAVFTVAEAAALQAALEKREDVGATKLFFAGEDKRSVWAAFYADNQ